MQNPIPTWAQSSIDPTAVSLTLTSIGKAGAGFIVFLGMLGIVDPAIAGQAWGGFVAEIITGVPVAFAIWNSGNAVWGVIRKAAVRLFAKAPVSPSTNADTITVVPPPPAQ